MVRKAPDFKPENWGIDDGEFARAAAELFPSQPDENDAKPTMIAPDFWPRLTWGRAQDLENLLDTAVAHKKWSAIAAAAREILIENGVPEAAHTNPNTPAGAILIAEGINRAAKQISQYFYDLKPYCVLAAWQMGAKFGADEKAFYLFHPEVGEASFHDPKEEIWGLAEKITDDELPWWEHGWSGKYRQDQAFPLLADYGERRPGDFLTGMARKTTIDGRVAPEQSGGDLAAAA